MHEPRPLGRVELQTVEQPVDMDQQLVVTCRSGGRVARTLPWLEQYGFEVANLDGGMRAWHAAGKAMQTANGSPAQVP